MKIIIAGGGTGGHIFPAVAIAHALRRLRPEVALLFVGAKGKMEMEKVPQEGFRIVGLDIAGFNRSNLFKNLSLPFKLVKSRLQANRIIRDFQPDAVVGVGGFASFPMLSAAQARNIPTLIQEQNSFAGKSNKLLGRKAKSVCVAYQDMERFFPKDKLHLTGNPVREVLSGTQVSHEEGLAAFKLSAQRKTVLVVGGSLGAKTINEAIDAGLKELTDMGVQLIWQTGKSYIDRALEVATAYGNQVLVQAFIRNMEYAYAAADVVISRAGAIASAELCLAGKPVIFVPYPFAAEDHQTSNAMALVAHNAAMMVADHEAKEELLPKLRQLLGDEQMQQLMAENITKHGIRDADTRIAHEVLNIINEA